MVAPPGKRDMTTVYGIRNCDTMKKAFALLLENPSMIRRPIVASGRTLLIGFDPDEYAKKLK
jgi:arsenate reductase-like glutaredoxin family protein